MSLVDQLAAELQKHHRTRGMAVTMGVTCACGYWTGSEKQPPRAAGSDGLDWHRAQVVAEIVERRETGRIVLTPEEYQERMFRTRDERWHEAYARGVAEGEARVRGRVEAKVEPALKTQEEKVAFRKEWDDRVRRGQMKQREKEKEEQ